MVGDAIRAVVGGSLDALTASTGGAVQFAVDHPVWAVLIVLALLVVRQVLRGAASLLVLKQRR